MFVGQNICQHNKQIRGEGGGGGGVYLEQQLSAH